MVQLDVMTPPISTPAQHAQTHTVSTDEVAALREENAQLKQRLAWFERQLFGQKSEKRPVDHPQQPSLLGEPPAQTTPEGEQITVTYQRGKAPNSVPRTASTTAVCALTPTCRSR